MARPVIARQYLTFLIRRRELASAHALAMRLVSVARAEDLYAFQDYVDTRLAEGAGSAAVEVWNALCRRGLMPYQPLDPASGVSITNGRFEHVALGSWVDWRFAKASWLRVVQGEHGGLFLTLTGDQPENCLLASQYVPVVAHGHYRLRLDPPSAGMEWAVYTPSEQAVPVESAAFTTPGQVVRLALMYRRPTGSVRFSGTIKIAEVRLEKFP
jgi:hypothetical protein